MIDQNTAKFPMLDLRFERCLDIEQKRQKKCIRMEIGIFLLTSDYGFCQMLIQALVVSYRNLSKRRWGGRGGVTMFDTSSCTSGHRFTIAIVFVLQIHL